MSPQAELGISSPTTPWISKEELMKWYEFTNSEDGWKPKKDVTVLGRLVRTSTKLVPGCRVNAFKFVTTYEAHSTDSARDLLHTNMVERHKEWNETFAGGDYLERKSDDENLHSLHYELPKPFTNRDFIMCRRAELLEDGTLLLADRSLKSHPKMVDRKGYVRTTLPFQIRQFRPIEGSNRIEFTYMNITDLNGWVPGWVTNRLNPGTSRAEVAHCANIIENQANSPSA
eukprot:Clim_evm25s198 gene=Clim_evmTU25s198